MRKDFLEMKIKFTKSKLSSNYQLGTQVGIIIVVKTEEKFNQCCEQLDTIAYMINDSVIILLEHKENNV